MKPAAESDIRSDTVEQALHTIERRVNELGVAEPVVARYGDGDRILVQLPGVEDVDRAKQVIRSTAQLRLTLVERGPFPSRDAALRAYNGSLPPALEVLPGPSGTLGADTSAFYVVQKVPVVSGNDLRDARQSRRRVQSSCSGIHPEEDAARRFGAFTERHVNRTLATVLDGRVTSVATILSRIDAQGQIMGLSREEMIEQVINFKSGALPADLEYVEEHTIGASLGEASIRSGVLASVGGLTLVMLFMLAYYRLAGLNALMSIVLEPAHPGRAGRVHSGHDDAAGDRRAHPHDRDGRRFERADLRAHQRGAGKALAAHERPSGPGSTASGSRSSTPTSRR